MKNKTVKTVISVIVAVVLLFIAFNAGVLVGTGGTVAGRFLSEYFDGENNIPAETSEIKITDPVKNIDVEWVSGNVTVMRSEDENIYILEDGDSVLSSSDALVYKIDKDTLEIDFVKPSFGIFGVSTPSKYLILKLPEKEYDSIAVTSVSADVDINNIRASDIDIEAVSGEIKIQQTTFKDLDIENVSGNADIYLSAASSFRAEIDSVSGNFNTDFEVTKRDDSYICGSGNMDISADTVSGNVGVYKKQ